ncbi:uncharacterized protein LOC132788147 [Drosophila nasuta]|uniref:uncharacterized protein LOC132788147 n=1 Tax=Drosophila nasuta TaxID=42062 RepID=UPI00295F30CA|nr:uncharacterized protein LOC132788147 [Drosophila nasuta]
MRSTPTPTARTSHVEGVQLAMAQTAVRLRKNKEQKKEHDPNDTSSASTEEHTDEPAKAHSARRKRAAPEGEEALDETLDTKDASNVDEADELHVENPEDYAQGCEVLEVNSKEANNETFLE